MEDSIEKQNKMDEWVDEWMDGWMDGRMGGWTDGWMSEWVSRPTYGGADEYFLRPKKDSQPLLSGHERDGNTIPVVRHFLSRPWNLRGKQITELPW